MTVLQEDVDFLAHYGVKGMKWGVRREKISTRSPKSSKKQKAKTAAKFIGGSSLVVGAAAVALTLSKNGNVKTSSIPRVKSKTPISPELAAILAKAKRPAGSSTSHEKWMVDFEVKWANTVKSANAQLRSRDNELSIPMAQRSYIQERLRG